MNFFVFILDHQQQRLRSLDATIEKEIARLAELTKNKSRGEGDWQGLWRLLEERRSREKLIGNVLEEIKICSPSNGTKPR